jgi:hypothetical protein
MKPLIPFFKKNRGGAVIPIAVPGGPGGSKVTQNLLHQKQGHTHKQSMHPVEPEPKSQGSFRTLQLRSRITPRMSACAI